MRNPGQWTMVDIAALLPSAQKSAHCQMGSWLVQILLSAAKGIPLISILRDPSYSILSVSIPKLQSLLFPYNGVFYFHTVMEPTLLQCVPKWVGITWGFFQCAIFVISTWLYYIRCSNVLANKGKRNFENILKNKKSYGIFYTNLFWARAPWL